ncbi:MAG TPA: NBR1-Ig-like domain-containing protein [Anaerolineales bacterium]|nr:NBR1-Ig-like domain-containing protein [Anaerolineales bacterium]
MLVRHPSRRTLFVLLTAALILVGCNMGATPAPTLDINAINTAIVGTTIAQLNAQFTQTALAVPTNTPMPTNTPAPSPTSGTPFTILGTPPTVSFNVTPTTPLPGFTQLAPPSPAATTALGDACNNNVFIADITIPDGSILKPGEDFQKVWRVQNTGTCKWDEGYALVFIGGDRAIDPYTYEFKQPSDFVEPGAVADLGINLTAPTIEGKYQGHWRMRSDKGYYFGTILSIYFEVKEP